MSLEKQLNHLSKTELIKVCKQCKCIDRGTKSELVDRILDSRTKNLLNILTVKQLKAILTKEKLSTTGKKSDLIERLQPSEITTADVVNTDAPSSELSKLLPLFKHSNTSYIHQGKQQFETLVSEEEQYATLHALLSFGIPTSYTDVYEHLKSQGCANPYEVAVWYIDLANQHQADWLTKRIRKYRIQISGYEWESCAATFCKETYEYWLDKDIESYLFNAEEYDEVIPKEFDFNGSGEWRQANDSYHESGLVWDPTYMYFKIEEYIADKPYKEITWDGDAQYIDMEIESVPFQESGVPETYGVALGQASRGIVGIGYFETLEDFDVTKLIFRVDCDAFEGKYLDRYDSIRYQSNGEELIIECELDYSYPKASFANLFKGSEHTYWKATSKK